MPLPIMLSLAFALLAWAPLVVAQSDLGALLDGGAKKLSAEEFRQELVQRVMVGRTPSGGGNLEIMYANNGVIQGLGSQPPFMNTPQSIRGEWKIDDSGKICTSMSIGSGPGIMLLLGVSSGSSTRSSISSLIQIRIAVRGYSAAP